MNRIVLFACVLLVAGCSVKYPETANIQLQVPDNFSTLYTGSSAYLRGHDARKTQEVAIYKINKEPAVKVPNITSPHIVITEQIAAGLEQQGLQFEKNSPVRILLELNQLLVTVTRTKLLYNSEAVSQITLKVTNRGTSLIREYNRVSSSESVFRPKINEIEDMLNDQLLNIANQVLADAELGEMISKM